ncbi:hypothetical protein [Lactococcus petauri]|uniref:hypothetical protein n=1 Tax=Lactococcus petauri TaxID=1940789 RepID=UPI0018A99F9F|nr:hypothetical protein [Lactococcus petauri]MDC0826895.1 hypothetical protein [Lactococcus petauri]
MAGLRYNENRVYQSRCQNMKCRETVTVTAPSGKAAEELFSKFEKGMIQPKLSIPKKIAEMLDYCYESEEGHADVGYIVSNVDILPEIDYAVYYEWLQETDDNKNYNLALAYLAGKALGVELVEVEG